MSKSFLAGMTGQPRASRGEHDRYAIRLASSIQDRDAALRLRFEVFNLELREGLESSYATGKDEDSFDDVCDHLILTERASGTVVGTYRLQTGMTAGDNLGYYSEQEFDFAPYEPIRSRVIELGRACVHRDHRTLAAVNRLWRGIADYATARAARYLLGCSSLTSQDPAEGAAMYHQLANHLVCPALRTVPHPRFMLPLADPAQGCPPIPRLLRAYLGLGARICGAPAIDRAFGTIDFLTLLDLQRLPTFVRAHFRIA